MANIIYRGSSCRIIFRPSNGLSVSSLGDPVIGISQEDLYIEPDTVVVDTANNRIYADLTQEQTLLLSDGIETIAQAAYRTQNGQVTRFPTHKLNVKKTVMWTIEEGE